MKYWRMEKIAEDERSGIRICSFARLGWWKGVCLPGMIKVWQPMMKMICMGPK